MTFKVTKNFTIQIDGWKLLAIIGTIISTAFGGGMYYFSWKTDKLNQAKEIHATYLFTRQIMKRDSVRDARFDSLVKTNRLFHDSVRYGYFSKRFAPGFNIERKDKRGIIHLEAVTHNP